MAAKKISYLKQLRFDPKLAKSLLASYLNNPRLVVLLILTILLVGITSFLTIPKVLNPDVKIPIVIVTTTLPAANPQDTESLLTIPIEDSLGSLTNVDTMTSTSQNSVSSVVVQFNSGVDPDKAQQDVQNAIGSVSNLPKDATKPQVQKLDFENTPVWTFSVTSNTGDTASLMRFGTILKQQLTDLNSIDHVTVNGLEQQEVEVILRPDAIAQYNLNPQLVAASITSATGSFPAGSVVTANSSFTFTIDPGVTTVKDIRNLEVAVNSSQNIQLGSIATVEEKAKPGEYPSYLATNSSSPKKSLRFDVYKTSSTTIQQAVQDAKAQVSSSIASYNGDYSVESLLDTGQLIDTQFSELIRDLTITVILVFLALFVFLGARQALVASIAIPLTFMITFTVMKITGIDLSFIAFFSLLLSLGLLVDDTVVVISATTAYFRTKKFTPLQTGLLVWRDFVTAIFTTTITTVWAFFPLLLATGIIGEFIKPVPIVVSSTLLGSFGVAMLITLPILIIVLKGYFPRRVIILVRILLLLLVLVLLIAVLPKNNLFIFELVDAIIAIIVFYHIRREIKVFIKQELSKHKKFRKFIQSRNYREYIEHGIISFETIGGNFYRRLLNKILSSRVNRRNTIIVVVLFSLFAYLLVPLGLVKNEFFPSSDQETFYVNIELPPGTNSSVASAEGLSILNKLRKIPEATYVTADIGYGINGAGTGFSSTDANNIFLTVVLPERGKRDKSSITLAQQVRNEFANYQKGTVTVTEESGGPPAGADVQVKLFGDDLNTLSSLADKVEAYLTTQPGVINIDKSIKPGTSKLVFVPDLQKMADNNITRDQVGFWLRTYASGFTADTVRLSGDIDTSAKDITIRTSPNTEDITSLGQITIPVPSGAPLPLTSLGSFKLEQNPTLITREDGKRTISITASVKQGYSVSQANTNVLNYVNNKLNLPQGYTTGTGGVNEENQKSVQSILEAMLLSFILILITMVLQFQSFRRALIVMLVIPLSVAGVFIVFAITNTPLSFPALIGMLALFGIVVKNSILIVDKIVQNLKAGIEYKYAIIDAAESRLEPIALTSFTAILGLIPITLSNALWQGLGGAIIAGLIFSGTIMLFFIPVVYYIIFAPKILQKR